MQPMFFTMEPTIKIETVGHVYHNLNELASRVTHIEQFIQEKEKKCVSRDKSPHIVSIVDMKESEDDMLTTATTNILVGEILKKEKSHLCHSLKQAKGKDTSMLEDRIQQPFDNIT